ncbi:primosomal protein N' [Rhodocaloribacter litoris]|uniref:replication restart helicase PriA n=1 Tax=Rhodocaloribacter litoris TaxID=2558931 RepID=UPI00141D9497|nr:primosomal protein N' [Rhodocaloribacter litoris]QXD14602.1 primosomal protein N' [Rhodocaloribacter litoris]
MPAAVRVVVPLPVDQTYTYLVPDDLQEEARVGCRVLVPFGPRRLTGMIVGAAEPAVEGVTLRPILDVLDETPSFTGEMLRLTRWIADYYVCGWGEVIKAALPSGIEVESRWVLVRTAASCDGWTGPPAARAVLRYLEVHGGEASLDALRQAGLDARLALARRLERDGLVRVEARLARPKVRVRREKHVRFAPAFRTPAARADLGALLRGAKQVAVVEALEALVRAGKREPRRAEVLARAGASAATLNGLVKKGILEVVEREVIRSPLDAPAPEEVPPPAYTLHPSQQTALDRIHEAVAAGRFETFLLHGVTGSGKTEVYIAALKAVVARGKTGIILVPEIALTPQTVRRFRAHFGDRIAVLHSRMSPGERYDAWRHLRSGRFSIVIGPRSAVLAPVSNLGLIVVDEEHEPSYKQFDPAPRYHARDVAVMRAYMNDAVCVLGSATPAVESYMNARWGKYTLLSMPERVPVPGHAAAPLPVVHIVDLALEHKKHRLDGVLSEPLRRAIRTRLDRNEQVILLQNRRGYAPVIACRSCGWAPMCPDCSVSMTYHKDKRLLRCHYCGRTRRLPPRCPKCEAEDLARLGAGTQRVEEELAACFPEARILRMDLDTTGRKNAHHELLERFRKGKAEVLLGTQMVAKGLDFPRVTLVGVVDADVGMLLPDFRAEERTFQLLTQVAGRAGRAGLRGEVILQTRNPDRPVLRYAVAHDYEGFVAAILPERELLGYPPFGRIVGVEFRGPQEAEVRQYAGRWTAALRGQVGEALDVLGPEAAFIGRVKRQYRFHTIIKVPRGFKTETLQRVLRHTGIRAGAPPGGSRVAIDVDAVGLF